MISRAPNANEWVDITDIFERKLAALRGARHPDRAHGRPRVPDARLGRANATAGGAGRGPAGRGLPPDQHRLRPLTVSAAALGAADTGWFLARRPQLFREAPSRAWGSAAFFGAWLALGAAAAGQGTASRRSALGLAGLLGAGNAAMLAAHIKAGVLTPRVFAGAGLSAVALGGVLASR